ncbi:MAG: hypothetical protein AAF843_06000 [Bacteroidota bacterium]
MIQHAANIIDRLLLKWSLLQLVEIIICSIVVSLSVYLVGFRGPYLITSTLLGLLVFLFWRKPWIKNRQAIVTLINTQLPSVQYSTGEILAPESSLTTLGKLQQHRAAKALVNDSGKIRLPFLWSRVIYVFVFCLLGVSIYETVDHYLLEKAEVNTQRLNEVRLTPLDSNSTIGIDPEMVGLNITITPPAYTGRAKTSQSSGELEVIESSRIQWVVSVNTPVDSVFLITTGTQRYLLKPLDSLTYEGSAKIKRNGYYHILLIRSGKSYTTDLFPIQVVSDQSPKLEVKGIEQRMEFNYWEAKKASFSCFISDDFGLTDSYIIATVSKGSGESVKFREQKQPFDQKLESGSRSALMSKTIDLDTMSVNPGDELYFYVEAVDNKRPDKLKSRTPTYFLTVRDTTDIEFSLQGDLGVDVVPEYFRSQRQIIIDTEKLMASKRELKESDFNFKSNEFGFDQKSLRIRYGQFMGEEFETDMSGTMEESSEDGIDNEDGESTDLLEEFAHNHDDHNEHNLVAYYKHRQEHAQNHDHENEHIHDHEHNHGDDHGLELGQPTEEDPLEQYQHIHDDPEEATFFTVTIKEKLRQALTEMWDAELYLRLYQPEKSLPYQYRSLKLLKEIKNHARVYVHRMGFDPPPIKEDSRLTGDLEEVRSSSRVLKAQPTESSFIYEACHVLKQIIEKGDTLSIVGGHTLQRAGDILGLRAVEEPGQYLETLGLLKRLIELNGRDEELAQLLLEEFIAIVDPAPQKIFGTSYPHDVLSEIFRDNLDQPFD